MMVIKRPKKVKRYFFICNNFFCGPCENRTRGSSVTGMNVSHYTNGPIFISKRPIQKPQIQVLKILQQEYRLLEDLLFPYSFLFV